MNHRYRRVSFLTLAVVCGHLAIAQAPIELPTGAIHDAAFVAGAGSPSGRLHQVLFSPAELQATAATSWSRIDLRAPAGGTRASTAVVAMWLSSQGVPTTLAMNTGVAAANRGTDRRQVIAPRLVSVPAAAMGWLPLTFDQPFIFPGGTGLLVEIEWTAPSALPLANFAATNVIGTGSWNSQVTRLDGSCSPTGRIAAAVGGSVFGDLTLDLAYEDASLAPTSPGLFLLGLQAANVPLAPFGAPGCVLRTGPDLALWAQPWGGVAVFTQRSTSPVLPSLVGTTAFVQGIFLQPGLNSLGILTTDALALRVNATPSPRRARHVEFDPASGTAGNEVLAVPMLRLQ